MSTSRRSFIKSTSITTAGLAILPGFTQLEKTGIFSPPFLLPAASPESMGVSSAAISRFIEAANASGLGWHSFMLLRHGHRIAEGWWKPFEPRFKHTLYSLSKSFTSTAIGLLVKEGKLDIHSKLLSFFPGDGPLNPDENLQKMEIRHLLTMNTGHAEDTMGKIRSAEGKWTKNFLELPVKFTPGSHFLYNTGATYMLGAVVHKITGQTLEKYLSSRLFAPLDITGYDWETSPERLNTAGYGLRVKTEDIAKFGQMYLQDGKWNGKEILSPAWVKEATSYQTSSQEGNGDWAQGYGYQFWRCKPGFYRGDGAFGQYCIVMPEEDAVLAVTSESWDMQKSMTICWENILPGIKTGKLPEDPAALATLRSSLTKLSLPVPTGTNVSMRNSNIAAKKYTFPNNDFGINSAQFIFSKDKCTWKLSTKEGPRILEFGWEKWLLNGDKGKYIFPVPGRLHMPSQMAGTATWIDDTTLQLDARFVEAMHGDKITCSFTNGKMSLRFLNSVAEHTKDNPEKRKEMMSGV